MEVDVDDHGRIMAVDIGSNSTHSITFQDQDSYGADGKDHTDGYDYVIPLNFFICLK